MATASSGFLVMGASQDLGEVQLGGTREASSCQRLEWERARKASMACAPGRLQRMPACFMRAWTTVLQADSIVPLPMGKPAWRKAA